MHTPLLLYTPLLNPILARTCMRAAILLTVHTPLPLYTPPSLHTHTRPCALPGAQGPCGAYYFGNEGAGALPRARGAAAQSNMQSILLYYYNGRAGALPRARGKTADLTTLYYYTTIP